jgi:hypothetical protein
MTQHTRDVTANSLLGVSMLLVLTFVAQHFMTSPRSSWHEDLPYIALAFVSASELVRGRMRRRAVQDGD